MKGEQFNDIEGNIVAPVSFSLKFSSNKIAPISIMVAQSNWAESVSMSQTT